MLLDLSASHFVLSSIIQMSSSHVHSIGCEAGGKANSQEASGCQVSGGNGGSGVELGEDDVTTQPV
jgi:hypothetical protein